MFIAVAFAILITMTFAIVRALLGPTVYDRVLAANVFGTKTVLFLATVAFLFDRQDFLDLALIYALINFVGILAVLNFFQKRIADGDDNDTDTDFEKRSEGAETDG